MRSASPNAFSDLDLQMARSPRAVGEFCASVSMPAGRRGIVRAALENPTADRPVQEEPGGGDVPSRFGTRRPAAHAGGTNGGITTAAARFDTASINREGKSAGAPHFRWMNHAGVVAGSFPQNGARKRHYQGILGGPGQCHLRAPGRQCRPDLVSCCTTMVAPSARRA